ncbi:DUF5615 family PIN-like protein [Thiohalocapsa marina]|uniref:DUF5615 family PIN-like protein n=1 Tax=Thiohalocapsa marina TaxID=424902 RepID=UPI0036DCE00C
MKIKLDENIPTSVCADLSALGHAVDSVMDEGLTGCPDPAVWAGAQREGRFLVTQDLDFSDVRQFAPGIHSGLLLLRLSKPGRRAVADKIRSLFATQPVESWSGCFVVATDIKIRVHRP